MLSKRVMLVEDDDAVASLLSLYLSDYGFEVSHERNGAVAAGRIVQELPDAVILDGLLPGMNGVDVCREVRKTYENPIIMLSALDDEFDQVVALELGADDYIVKPTAPRVLLAHLKACLRRASHDEEDAASEILQFNDLTISSIARTVTLNGTEIMLTDSEFDLLWLLASNAGQVISRGTIYEQLRGRDYDGLDRSIDMKISRLRKHLCDDSDHPNRIKTVRGKGYLFSRI